MFEKLKNVKKRWWVILAIVLISSQMSFTPDEEVDDKSDDSPKQQTASIEAVSKAGQSDSNSSSDEAALTEEKRETVEKSIGVSLDGYKMIIVDGGNTSGYREPNTVVDIGFGDREYWAFTNENGQLIKVVAASIIPQNASKEPVNSNGRYYNDEAAVPGTEREDMDQGHVIADSLGGVSNAYNITPQDSVMNRHGDQAYMERVIRDAGGCTNFEAIITYPDTKTKIPSHYHYTYTINENVITEDFDNVNPDKVNSPLPATQPVAQPATQPAPAPSNSGAGNLASVDINGNGKVTISEAKAAGFKMPITRDHWLYPYMDDRDGDGMVGE